MPTPTDLVAGAVWVAIATPPGAAAAPAELAGARRLPASVPGTAAGVLASAGLTGDVDQQDWWWQTVLPAVPAGSLLALDGVATVSEVWVDQSLVHRGNSMFVAEQLALPALPAGCTLSICARALGPLLAERHPRPGWRTRLVPSQNLRWFRTALLGRMPSMPGAPPVVGPWRGVQVVCGERVLACAVRVADGRAHLEAELTGPGRSARLRVGSRVAPLQVDGSGVRGSVDLTGLDLWSPVGAGSPTLHAWALEVDGDVLREGRLGIRQVAPGRPFQDGLAVVVNGRPVFCRGAVWLPLDPVSWQSDPVRLRTVLTTLRDAGLNMLRVPGFSAYEQDLFYDLCDELGLLVWQDLALANLDPPCADEAWRSVLDRELAQLAARLAAHPSVVVVCGGSETEQQAAMVGADAPQLRVFLGEVGLRFTGVLWVDNSPTGGPRPFSARPGVTHWFGVGAYLRPLAEAASADVGFASECLAFAVPADPPGVRELAGGAGVTPRDVGSSWDFQDVTDHYVRAVFDLDPVTVRWSDPEYAADLCRAAVVECVTGTLAAWRSPLTPCAGAVLLAARDLVPGAGWGLLDNQDRPKAVLQALPDVLSPTALVVVDRGLDGVAVHVVRDAPAAAALLEIEVYDLDGELVAAATVPATGDAVDVETALGGFRDLNHAHAFGPAHFDVLRVRLVGPEGHLAETTHFLRGPRRARLADVGLQARADGASVVVSTVAAAQRVAFDLPGHVPAVGWFHLAPGASRRVPVRGAGPVRGPVRGTVRALNSRRAVPITAA